MSTAAGIGAESRLQRRQVHLEILHPGRDDVQFQARALDVGFIFREIGRDDHHFLPRPAHTAQGVGQGARRAAGHEDMLGAVLHAETAVQAFRHRLAHRRDAQQDGLYPCSSTGRAV